MGYAVVPEKVVAKTGTTSRNYHTSKHINHFYNISGKVAAILFTISLLYS